MKQAIPHSSQTSLSASFGTFEEIVTNIFSHFSDCIPAGDWADPLFVDEEQCYNRQALLACALVNRTWHNAAQKLIYNIVSTGYHEQSYSDAVTTFEQHPHLLDHVRVLYLTEEWLERRWPLGWTVFSRIPNLQVLKLRDHPEWITQERHDELWHALRQSEQLCNVKKFVSDGYTPPSLTYFRSQLDVFQHMKDLEIHTYRMSINEERPIIQDIANNSGAGKPLHSFKWIREPYGLTTFEFNPLHVLAWFDVSQLETLVLDVTETNWAPILSLCSEIKHSLKNLQLTYTDHDDVEDLPRSPLPNLLELASELSSTASSFILHMQFSNVFAWMQQTLHAVGLSTSRTIISPKTNLHIHARHDPPVDLQPFADTLRALRKYVGVKFTFEAHDDTEERLFEAAPMLAALISEGLVELEMLYHS